ncbi:MAG: hypothetical protein CBD18_05965 [Opitutales bacterium TMED158]|nr:MAG: hypothetical protein CBD18_05965 [Opitutales bacterium TMED158]
MGNHVWAIVSGALFGLGLMLSGMTNPDKVKGFLNFFGKWDPTLMIVLGVAVPIYFVSVKIARLMLKTRPKLPFVWLEPEKMTPRFFIGSIMFGLGWGLVGLCPGPALVSLGSLSGEALLFFAVMMASIFTADVILKRFE